MLKIIAAVVAALIALVLALAVMKPAEFSVQRSVMIKAPPEKAFALANDFHNWAQWSPWEKLDTTMKKTYGGPATGVGATYEWVGNSKVGAGRMEITESVPSSKVLLKLDFTAPMAVNTMTVITFAPKGEMTEVTWHYFGPNTFLSKVMAVFISMDKMVGGDFERGLGNMKLAAEK